MRGYQLIKKIQNGEIDNCKIYFGYSEPYKNYIEVKDKQLRWQPSTFNTRYLADYQMNFEVEKPILDDKEKEYLSAVIKPFRNDVMFVKKISYHMMNHEYEYIYLDFRNDETMDFPYFEENTMYKGMALDRAYSLEELGL